MFQEIVPLFLKQVKSTLPDANVAVYSKTVAFFRHMLWQDKHVVVPFSRAPLGIAQKGEIGDQDVILVFPVKASEVLSKATNFRNLAVGNYAQWKAKYMRPYVRMSKDLVAQECSCRNFQVHLICAHWRAVEGHRVATAPPPRAPKRNRKEKETVMARRAATRAAAHRADCEETGVHPDMHSDVEIPKGKRTRKAAK